MTAWLVEPGWGLTVLRPWLLLGIPVPLLLMALRRPGLPSPGAPWTWAPEPASAWSSVPARMAWHGPRWMAAGAAACLLVAAAGPVSVREVPPPLRAGAAVMAVLDVSGSMREGMDPALPRARAALQDFLSGSPALRLGLVTFAGEALTRLPPTSDPGLVRAALETAAAGLHRDGSAMGTALGLAAERLAAVEARTRTIVLLTDGLHNAGAVDPVTAARLARSGGVTVHAILLGETDARGREILARATRAGGGRLHHPGPGPGELAQALAAAAPLPGDEPTRRYEPVAARLPLLALALLVAAQGLRALRPGRWS